MVMNLFKKPDVVLEGDTATPGTPYRLCMFRVTGRKPDNDLSRKVRAALQMAVPGCEVADLPLADVKVAEKMGMRFRVSYYGEQIPGEKIRDAVLNAI